MKASLIPASLLAGVCLTASPGGFAQPLGDLSIDASECVQLESEVERLACYDRLATSARMHRAERGNAATLPVNDEIADGATRSDRPLAVDGPAHGGQEVDESFDPPTVLQSPAEHTSDRPGEFVSTITALEQYRPNAYELTLANGQTWRQVEAKRYPLRIGYTVRVYPSKWADSYRLSAEELHGFIRIKRVE